MSKINIFCFGFGQVAECFINKIIQEKKDFDLTVTSRQETHQVEFNNIKIKSYQFTDDKFDKSITKKLEEANYILISIPPIDSKDIVVSFLNSYQKKLINCKWITKPSSPNGLSRLQAEKSWISFSNKKNYPLQIFRLAGIYSNEFNILKRLQTGKIQIVNKKNHFFSRIHVEDIANILYKSLDNFKNNEIYNICDDKPAPQSDVVAYGSKLLKLEQPKPVKLEEIKSEMLQNFYKDSKKVDNKKMKAFFKYNLKFPSYIEGLDYIFNNNI